MLTHLRSLKRGHALKTPDREAFKLTKAQGLDGNAMD